MDVIVKESKIHGKGVFANRDFKKGEIVLKWNPKRISKEFADKLSGEEKEYIMFEKREHFLQQSPERFMNHSCSPNTRVGDFCDIAIRDIKKGEEITSYYSKGLAPDFKMKCACGSKNCKGIIKYEN